MLLAVSHLIAVEIVLLVHSVIEIRVEVIVDDMHLVVTELSVDHILLAVSHLIAVVIVLLVRLNVNRMLVDRWLLVVAHELQDQVLIATEVVDHHLIALWIQDR